MTLRSILLSAIGALLAAAVPLAAKDDAEAVFRQFRSRDQVTLRPDRAYLLLRIDTDLYKFHAHVLRVPSDEEAADYEAAKRVAFEKAGERAGAYETFRFTYDGAPNFFALNPGRDIETVSKIAVVLAEVLPGEYVFYGMGYGNYLQQCFCLGTVGFAAPAGQITDVGTMITDKAWEPSSVPELQGEAGLGRGAMADYGMFAVALIPSHPGDARPARLAGLAANPAVFRAVGPYVEPNTTLINRLAPIAGVLAYREGRVIDVPTGAEVPPTWEGVSPAP